MNTDVKTRQTRVNSIDVMRSLTMLLMLFVNDIPGTKNVPHWLFHAAHNEDMLGFSDTIFPAFLFCVGLSVTFALGGRLRRCDSQFSVLSHVLWRTFALVTMGLFTLNGDEGAGNIPHIWFSLLMVLGFFLVWTDYKGLHLQLPGWAVTSLRTAGGLLLAAIVVYCDVAGKPFHTGWWGILGLIGWSYMVCALTWLVCRGRLGAVLLAWGVSVAFCVLSQSSLLPHSWFLRNILLPWLPGGWTGHALCISGMAASMLMTHFVQRGQALRLTGLFVAIGLLMLLLGLWAHHYWIISKIQATPTWLFFCLAIYFPLLVLIHWLVGQRRLWLIAPAGTATLTCYLLPYIWYPLRWQVDWHLPWSWYNGLSGLLLSLFFALMVIQVVRLMQRIGWTIRI